MKLENKVKTRYSDSELKEFKELITNKLTVAREELEHLSSSLQSTNNSHESREDMFTTHAEKEMLLQQIGHTQKFIDDLEAALRRIANKTYGVCRQNGTLIPKERLRASLVATLCMEAKLQEDEKKPARAA